jgi:hypothetical protein
LRCAHGLSTAALVIAALSAMAADALAPEDCSIITVATAGGATWTRLFCLVGSEMRPCGGGHPPLGIATDVRRLHRSIGGSIH